MYAFIRWKRCQLESTWKIKIAFLLNSFSSVSVSCCAENTIASEIQNRENCISNRADDRGWMSQLQLLHLEWQFHLYATHMFTVTRPMVCNFVMPEANLFQKLFCGTQKGKTETYDKISWRWQWMFLFSKVCYCASMLLKYKHTTSKYNVV